jgi:ribosome-associated heat shock protein Hsp15
MRIDRFLWFARLSATRAFAQKLAAGGHLRVDGRRIEKASAIIRVGDVLTFATHRGIVRVVRVEALPERRGSPTVARTCYTELTIDGAARET